MNLFPLGGEANSSSTANFQGALRTPHEIINLSVITETLSGETGPAKGGSVWGGVAAILTATLSPATPQKGATPAAALETTAAAVTISSPASPLEGRKVIEGTREGRRAPRGAALGESLWGLGRGTASATNFIDAGKAALSDFKAVRKGGGKTAAFP